MTRLVHILLLILVLTTLATACGENERVRRVTRVEYLPLAKDARVEVVTYPVKRVYDRIAIVDSRHYALPDYYPRTRDAIEMARHKAAAEQHEKMFEKMREELRVMARELGGDCVQNVRQNKVEIRGILPDQRAPLPGLKTQGTHDEYFLRGEVIKLSPRKAPGKTPEIAPPELSDTETSATAESAPNLKATENVEPPVLPSPPTPKEENAEADENAAPETPVDAPQADPALPPQEDSQPEQEMSPPKQ